MRYTGHADNIRYQPALEAYERQTVHDAAVTVAALSIAGKDGDDNVWLLKSVRKEGSTYFCRYDWQNNVYPSGTTELSLFRGDRENLLLAGPWQDGTESGRWFMELSPVKESN